VAGKPADYSDVADEYYRVDLHPTSANFRDGSRQLLLQWLASTEPRLGWICEVGAGHALVAETLGNDHAGLLVLDNSPGMLAHSASLASTEPCVALLLSDARALPLAGGSISAVVAILGDPYDEPAFWSEVARVLAPGGAALFTTPAVDWATQFRDPEDQRHAAFDVGGAELIVPSTVRSEAEQTEIISASGLEVREVVSVCVADISPPLSPKLLVGRGPEAPVVTGYFVSKPVAT
jgi:SAM-dependent methyltransferase